MSLLPPLIHQLDACILLAPAQADDVTIAHVASLVAMVKANVPVHILLPEPESAQVSAAWNKHAPDCRISCLPSDAGSEQTRTFAQYLRKNGVLRPWVILWQPSFARMATRIYAPAKAFIAGPWLMASTATMDTQQARIEHHLLHIFMSRQASVIFSTDSSMDAFLRKDLGYYGSILPRESWESEWKSERDLAMTQRVTETPHYSHKLEILIEVDVPSLKDSVHAAFINNWMQRSRHRVNLCRHAEDDGCESALRSREEFDVLIRVCEPAGETPVVADWICWRWQAGHKMMLVPQICEDHQLWAERHGVHHVLPAESLKGEACFVELDELLSRQVHGLQHWALQQPKQLIHHGVESTRVAEGVGGLDELEEHYHHMASIWPLNLDPIYSVLRDQRETLERLDEEIERLEKASQKQPAGNFKILNSLKKRMRLLFR